ncbi:MAG TPA: archaeosortase/exosortase family protein [Rubricoccaceae bacterium]|nr:archaeosortase/exosortase family protein [Rubricoccaceae bacterium]
MPRLSPPVSFVAILLVCYGAWYAAYELVLRPDGRLDAAVAHAVAATAWAQLDVLGQPVAVSGRTVRLAGTSGVFVEDGCNGLSALGLFAGFVLAYPGRWRRRLWFVPLGLLVVFLANVARVAALAYFAAHWPAGFDLLHSVGTSAFFYFVIFGLWVLWAHVGGSRLHPASALEPALAT